MRQLALGFAGFLLSASLPSALAQTEAAKDWERKFDGVWSNASLTPVNRPSGVDQLVIMDEAEAAALAFSLPISGVPRDEAGLTSYTDPDDPAPEKGGRDFGLLGYNAFWLATGDNLAKVKGEFRTSYIVDPPNGRMPHKDPAAVARRAQAAGYVYVTGEAPYAGPEELGLAERCLLGFSGTAGPGMLTPQYNNTYQFVLTDDHLMILVEMVHDARIIPIYGSAEEARANHKPAVIKPWMGDSVAWWEDDVLVAETINIHPIQGDQGAIRLSENGKVTERFQRYSETEIFYSFTVEDEEMYSEPWTAELSFHPQVAAFEYACHEGNYGLFGILEGARLRERVRAGTD